MKNTLLIIGAIIVLVVSATWWSRSLQSNDATIISTSGIHWHPRIEVFVKGEKQEVPANIGIGMQYAGYPHYDSRMMMTPMHTHENDGIIHMEFPARVTKDDAKLGNFLSLWGKNFFASGLSEKLTVNGKESDELSDYGMKDGDIIVLQYE